MHMIKQLDPKKIIDTHERYYPHLYSIRDHVIVKGNGAFLYDSQGNEYLDCVAGHGVMNIGHNHPKFIEAIKKQLESVVMVPPAYPVESRANLLEKLAEITPKSLTQSFLSNSGTEAIEAAIKLAIKSKTDIKKPEIIAFKRAFHGRTIGSLAMTFNMKYRKPFLPWLSPNVKFASYGDLDSVRELINDNTVAVITELIQGEGGVYPAPDDFPKALRELCNEKNLLLIDDEIQAGFGRTGKMFACEHYGIEPDVICMAKAIAGGLPMGATIASEELWNQLKSGEHYSTFGGNPLICAAASATIDIIREEHLVENAERQGNKLISSFNEIAGSNDHIRGIRGKGLMIGVDFRKPVKERIDAAVKKGVLFLNAGLTVIRLLPPLIINDDQVNRIIKVIKEISE